MLSLLLLLVSPPTPDAVIARSTVVATIPADVHLAEAIALDRGRLLTGSVVNGGLWRQRGSGFERLALSLPSGGIFAMALEPSGRRLWLSVAGREPFSGGREPFAGLVSVDLRRGLVERRVSLPAGATPGDLAVLADGTVYVSDQTNGGVYRCRPECDTAGTVIGKAEAPSPQGIAPALGGTLYVADYARGILRFVSATGRVELLDAPPGSELRGIDGLIWWRGQLIGVQNGTKTRRILRITLAADGRTVTAVVPIEQAHPGWGEPTMAVLDGDRLLYVADAQWEAWSEDGARKPGIPLRPTPVRALPLKP